MELCKAHGPESEIDCGGNFDSFSEKNRFGIMFCFLMNSYFLLA